MVGAWDVLEQAGVPVGAVRCAPVALPDAVSIHAALTSISTGLAGASVVGAGAREPLIAWLRALRHHWPSRYDDLVGEEEGRRLLAWLESDPIDPNRYLKLRRIAIENLTGVL